MSLGGRAPGSQGHESARVSAPHRRSRGHGQVVDLIHGWGVRHNSGRGGQQELDAPAAIDYLTPASEAEFDLGGSQRRRLRGGRDFDLAADLESPPPLPLALSPIEQRLADPGVFEDLLAERG